MKPTSKMISVKFLCAFLVTVIISCCINVWYSQNVLTTTNYTVSMGMVNNPFRILLLSDLHDHTFGTSNSRLVNKVEEASPDLIVLDGDMLNEDSEKSDTVTTLIRGLIAIAPVYYSLGNHEIDYMKNGHEELISELEEAGAVVLNYEIEDITVNGNDLRLGGLYEYGFSTSMQTEEENEAAVSYMEEYTDTDRYLIMCAHRPESFYPWGNNDSWGIDLQLSGHLHGGQVRIPFVGGLYAPLQGFFPQYDAGLYEIGDCNMIITRGLGTNKKLLPRFNNPPEIAIVDVIPE